MSDFRITGPGDYRMRNGEKVKIVAPYGKSLFTDFDHRVLGRLWRADGRKYNLLSSRDDACSQDIVGGWEEPTAFTVTAPGRYKNREGCLVVVTAIDAPGRYPVVGYTEPTSWMLSGHCLDKDVPHKADIVGLWPQPQPATAERWANVTGTAIVLHRSKQAADDCADEKRDACRLIRFVDGKLVDLTDEVQQ